MKNIIRTVVLVAASIIGTAGFAKIDYPTLPPIPTTSSVIPETITGVWVPTYGTPIGMTFVLAAGRVFVSAWGQASCTNVLLIRGAFPKTNPTRVLFGEKTVTDGNNRPVFGTPYTMIHAPATGTPATVSIDSYDPVADQVTITVSNNTYGYNGPITLSRQFNLIFPQTPGC